MTELDLILRGGCVALCTFLIAHFLLARANWDMRLSATAFLLGVIGHSLASSLGGAFDGNLTFLLARLEPALFWWFALVIFEEKRPPFVLPLALIWLGVNPLVSGKLSNPLHQITTIALLSHVIFLAFTGLDEDLVAPRRWFRWTVGLMIPLTGLVISYFELFPAPSNVERWLVLVQATAFLGLALLFALWLTKLNRHLLPEPPKAHPSGDSPEAARLAARLAEGVHRTEGLTIGTLAKQLEMPEHRLRQLINAEMGYRNFSELLNDLRVDEAKAKLSDPDHASKQISQIAYGVGYSSLAPFNRAFRSRTGQSPSDFRRERLGLA